MANVLIPTGVGNTTNQVVFVDVKSISSAVDFNHGTSLCVNITLPNEATSTVPLNNNDLCGLVVTEERNSNSGSNSGGPIPPDDQAVSMVNLSDLRVIVNQERDSSSGSSSGGHIAPDDQALSMVNLADLHVIVNQERDSNSGSCSGGHIAPDKPSIPVQMVSDPRVLVYQERDSNSSSCSDGHVVPDKPSVAVQVVENEVRDLNSSSTGTNEQSAAIRTDGINVVDHPAPPGRPTCGICQKTGHRMVCKSKTPCGHLFCYRCIRTWVDESPSVVNCFTCHRIIDSFIHHGHQTYHIHPIGPDGKRRKPSAPGQKLNKVRTPRPRRRNRGGGGAYQQL